MDGVHFKCGVVDPTGLCGATGDEMPADQGIQDLCDSVKADFLAQSGLNVSKFAAVSYRSQVVSGQNYFVKVDIGDGQYCHLRIYEPLSCTKQKSSLSAFQVKADFVAQSGLNVSKYVVVSFTSQVVSGRNYFVKVKVVVEVDEYCHLRIYEPLPYTGLQPSL